MIKITEEIRKELKDARDKIDVVVKVYDEILRKGEVSEEKLNEILTLLKNLETDLNV